MDANGEGYFPDYHYPDSWYSSGNMEDLYYLLQAGYGIALSLAGPGGHAVTCWGFNYDPDTGETLGIWITDSDDSKGSTTPPDLLRYYEVELDGSRWYLQDYYGSDAWYVRSVRSLLVLVFGHVSDLHASVAIAGCSRLRWVRFCEET